MIAVAPHGKAHWVADENLTLCGRTIAGDWQTGAQSEYAFLNTAEGACTTCQKALQEQLHREDEGDAT